MIKSSNKSYSKTGTNNNYTFNSFGSKSQDLIIVKEIKEWINKIKTDNFDEMISIFELNKTKWNEQIKLILKELTRNHKNYVLDYILKNIQSNLSNSTKKKYISYTLLNENVWVGKNNNVGLDDFQSITETFDILISNGFNFIDFSVINNELSNKHGITEMLINLNQFYFNVIKKDTRFSKELQKELFEYITIKMNFKNIEVFINSIQKNPNILNKINLIIDIYYTEERILERRLKQTESFLGALMNDDNGINIELRDKLYNYFTTIYWNKQHFVSCLTIMFNKITDSNCMLFIDNIQFLLSRNVDVMTFEIFKLIVSRESTNISEKNIVNCLLSNLVGRTDLIKYFESIDIKLIKHQFITNILNNYTEWIEEVILHQKKLNPDVPNDEFKNNDYGVLMMILGIAYSKGYMCEEILNVISRIIESDVNLIKPFGIFLETSKINPNILVLNIQELISKYILRFYFNSKTGLREKYTIESVLSNFISLGQKTKIDVRIQHIEHFMNYRTFIITTQSNKKLLNKKQNISNRFALISVSDDEKDEKDEDEEDEEDEEDKNEEDENEEDENIEPNEKILNQINSYFKSNGTDDSFDDLKYFIETTDIKIKCSDFAYTLFYSLGERKIKDINTIKMLIQKMSQTIGFEELMTDLTELIKTNFRMIEILKCDNPMLIEIIDVLKKF